MFDYLQDSIEENTLRLIDTRHMLDLVLFILKLQSLVFDGTSRLGEVLAIMLLGGTFYSGLNCLAEILNLSKSGLVEKILMCYRSF